MALAFSNPQQIAERTPTKEMGIESYRVPLTSIEFHFNEKMKRSKNTKEKSDKEKHSALIVIAFAIQPDWRLAYAIVVCIVSYLFMAICLNDMHDVSGPQARFHWAMAVS